MSERRVLIGSTDTLVSYPRVGTTGAFLRSQPTSVTVRIGTPASPLATVEAVADVEKFAVVTTADAAEGDDSLAFTAELDAITAAHGPSSGVASPAETLSTTGLESGTTYTLAVSFSLEVLSSLGAPEGFLVGTLVANVTLDADGNLTVNSQTPTYSQRTGECSSATMVVAAGAANDLRLNFSIGAGSLSIGDTRTFSDSITATPTTSAPSTAVAGHRYILAGDELLEEVEAEFVGAGTMRLTDELIDAVPSGTQILGFACSKQLTTLQTSITGRGCLAIWTATFADGTKVTWADSFRVVRRMVSSSLTPSTLREKWPVVRTWRDRNDRSLERTLLQSWEDDILPLLETQDPVIDAEDIISVGALEPLHALAVVIKMALPEEAISEQVKTQLQNRWKVLKDETFARDDWYEAKQVADPIVTPVTKRRLPGIRLVR